MSLLLATEFVEHCITKNQYFSAKELYLIGKTFGITNSEVYDNFLGKNRAVSRGKYIPAYISSKKLKYAQAQAQIKQSKFAMEQLRWARKTGWPASTTFSTTLDNAVATVLRYEKDEAMTPLPTTSN